MPVSVVTRTATVVLDHELLQLVSSLVCLIENGEIIFLNTEGLRMLGLVGPDDAVGRALEEFVTEDYRFLVQGGWDILADEDFLPLKLVRGDGSTFEAELRVRRPPSPSDALLVEGRDISKYLRSAEALREREERLQGILASVAEGIVTLGEDGIIQSANPAAERMFEAKRNALLGLNVALLMAEEMRPVHDRMFSRITSGTAPGLLGRTVETIGRRHSGAPFPMELSLSELRQGRGRLFTAIVRDISERKEHEERIKRLAHHDYLTGLPNRNLLNDRMEHALARTRRNGGRMAVLFVDLDKFKPINDTLGHEAGDVVLREVADRLSACVRSSDTVARVGGDEFVVVMEEIGRPVEAAVVARKIIDSLSLPVMVQTNACTVGASIGVAVFPDDGSTLNDVCKAADAAMYRVKHSGRNGFSFFAVEDGMQGEYYEG